MAHNQPELFEVSGKALLFNFAKDKIVLLKTELGFTIPGGHLEDGETPEMAARREVREELGIDYREELRLFYADRHHTHRDTEKIDLYFMGELDEKTPIDISRSGDDLQKYEWAPVARILRGEYESWLIDILEKAQAVVRENGGNK